MPGTRGRSAKTSATRAKPRTAKGATRTPKPILGHYYPIPDARVSERVGHFPMSVIRDMTRVANEHKAINLAQGFPDFDPPRELLDAAKKAIDDGYNQYAMTAGAPALRQALAEKVRVFNGIECDPDANLCVTCGATEAMMAAMLAIVDPGDEAIIPEPFYENFGPDAVVSGARPRFVPMDPPDFQLREERLKKAFTRKTKAIIVNTPGNPTGRVLERGTLKLIADLCADHDVVAVTDEIYEHLVYDGLAHTSLATLGDMAERTITIGGFSKTYSVTGWRLAYTVAPKTLTDAIKRVHDFLTVGAPHPLQIAAVAALRLPPSYYEQLRKDYEERRAVLLEGLTKAGFTCFRPNAAYYIMTDVSRFGFPNDTEFAMWLTREVGVASVPGSSFYANKERGRQQVRFAFPKKIATLRAAVERLGKMEEKLAAAPRAGRAKA